MRASSASYRPITEGGVVLSFLQPVSLVPVPPGAAYSLDSSFYSQINFLYSNSSGFYARFLGLLPAFLLRRSRSSFLQAVLMVPAPLGAAYSPDFSW